MLKAIHNKPGHFVAGVPNKEELSAAEWMALPEEFRELALNSGVYVVVEVPDEEIELPSDEVALPSDEMLIADAADELPAMPLIEAPPGGETATLQAVGEPLSETNDSAA